MSNHRPAITTTYGFPPPDAQSVSLDEHKANLAAASAEAFGREMAYLRALNGPTTRAAKLPALREPVLPTDFQARVDALDEEIYKRGIAVSRDRLLSLGQERFQELLALDRAARSLQRVIGTKADLTSWASVEYAFACVNGLTTMVPKRKDAEVNAGVGLDREAAARMAGFADLWKTSEEPGTARNVYAFHHAFVSLVLGQSLLERLCDDDRARSYSLCGSGTKGKFFAEWLGVLEGSHFTLTLRDPLSHLVAWLANDKSLPPTGLASYLLGVRVPSKEQLKLCDAVWHGFLLGYSGWSLWDFVGRATRKAMGESELEEWRRDLGQRYPAIQAFNDALRAAFYRQVGGPDYNQILQFDAKAHRSFVNRSMESLLNLLSGLLALALEEMLPGACVARFQSWLLCDVNSKRTKNYPKNFLGDLISEKLEAAFPGQRFYFNQFKVEELPA